MEEINKNNRTDDSSSSCAQNTADLYAEKERLTAEVEKAKKRQKIFKFMIIFLTLVSLSGVLFVYWVYRKVNEYKPFIENAAEMARQSSAFMEANKLQAEISSSRPSTMTMVSQSGLTGSSLSMISFGQDAASAAEDPQARQEMAEVVDEYKETPEMKEMLDEFKKDPELKTILENSQSDPSKMMKKINDPAVMKKIIDKMAKNPKFMATMMKMATDPRVMKAVSKQRSAQNASQPANTQ